MDKPLYLAIDQGGHSSRALVFDSEGQVVAQAKYNVKVSTPQPDWAEQNAEELVWSIQSVLQEIFRQLGTDVRLIVAAGLATQRSNVVCWDRHSGVALSSAISWQDRRAHAWLSGFADKAHEIHARTGLLLTAHYGASKLRWCEDHIPAVTQALTEGRLAWGPMAAYLVYQITLEQRHLVDPANASRTLLWNLQQQDWDPYLLELFGVTREPLPSCVATCFQYGTIPLGEHRVPLVLVTGDQSAALYAYGKASPDTAYINMGTGAFLQIPTGDQVVSVPRLLSSIVIHDGVQAGYVLECTVNGAGSALTLVEDELGMSYELAESQFATWLDQANHPPVFLNGVSGLGAPFWIPDFKSRFAAVGDKENKWEDWEKIVAVAESIIFLLKVNLDTIATAIETPLQKILLTGGLALSDGLCQRLADLSRLPVERPEECEATARGTAFLVAGAPAHWSGHHSHWFYPCDNPSLQNRFQHWLILMEEELKAYQSVL
ncbi:MAG: FGGY family carbohydrate kinase [Gammaproteobacteria bacterium]|nr:FGGY family carbohydrate kinase [Gammaproteobacteria bacterium]MDH5801857.1 FGGY family carbohydrate kinase [Gammaproteobacteria bacterium]